MIRFTVFVNFLFCRKDVSRPTHLVMPSKKVTSTRGNGDVINMVNPKTVAAGITKVNNIETIPTVQRTNSKDRRGAWAEGETITGMEENLCQEKGKEA